MADRVDTAIAALKVALKEAENSGDLWVEGPSSKLLD